MLIVHCAGSRGKGRKLAECAACTATPAVCTGTGGQPTDWGTEAPTASQVVTRGCSRSLCSGARQVENAAFCEGEAWDILKEVMYQIKCVPQLFSLHGCSFLGLYKRSLVTQEVRRSRTVKAHNNVTLGLCYSPVALKLLQNEKVLNTDIRGHLCNSSSARRHSP